MSRLLASFCIVCTAVCWTGCTTTTIVPRGTPESVNDLLVEHKKAALSQFINGIDRVTSLSWPILKNSAPRCGADSYRIGVALANSHSLPRYLRETGESVANLTDQVQFVAVAADGPAEIAGIRPRDELLSIDGVAVAVGSRSQKVAYDILREEIRSTDPVLIRVRRHGEELSFEVHPQGVCQSRVHVTHAQNRLAYTRGIDIFLRAASVYDLDDEGARILIASQLAKVTAQAIEFDGSESTTSSASPESHEPEQDEVNALALAQVEEDFEQIARFNELAWPILTANAQWCGPVSSRNIGLSIASFHSLSAMAKSATISLKGLTYQPQVVAVVRGSPADEAGLRAGDKIHQINGVAVEDNPRSVKVAHRALKKALRSVEPISIQVHRNRSPMDFTVRPVSACDSFIFLTRRWKRTGFADGTDIFLSHSLADEPDDVVQFVIAHELAHNAERHIRNQIWNSAASLLAGHLLWPDAPEATYFLVRLGFSLYSVPFEREADYVGMYMLERAGVAVERVSTFWTKMSVKRPLRRTRTVFPTHPIPAERIANIRAAQEEIRQKKESGDSLVPERRRRIE